LGVFSISAKPRLKKHPIFIVEMVSARYARMRTAGFEKEWIYDGDI
jgi:hypothetical protein